MDNHLQLVSQQLYVSSGRGLLPEDFWHVYTASPLEMKQALQLQGLFSSLSTTFAELGLPSSSCICKKGNTGFRCRPLACLEEKSGLDQTL